MNNGTIDGQLLHRYRRHLTEERRLADLTVCTYLSDARTFRDWCLTTGRMPQAMDRQMHGDYIFYLLQEAPDRRRGSKSGGLQRTTVKRMLSGLRSLYRFLVQEGWYQATPVPSGRSSNMKTPQPLPAFLTQAEASRLLEACDPLTPLEVRDRALLEALYACGPRLEELYRLDVANVDLMTYTMTSLGHGPRERNGPFGDPAWIWLRRYLEEARPTLARDGNPALWLNNRGGRLSPGGIGRIVKRYAEAAGLGSRVHPHTLRHSFASHLLDGGADISVVQKLLGHQDPASTEIYTVTTVQEHRRAYLQHHPMARATAPPLPTLTTKAVS